eukprot:CAMPEP_0177256404 /NCGR_PEP_ID=MMETSP0367-20130122/56918_1 /TAXON_ID=447022 ORGANISM="Scrippsiella hangoei-like, Strain SHHI-4" /NCGR_SAMPLE_ID=MMETSP0367 /ASSEMBLY_ACC=CAM_ASM_000362 /LENGTH=128 /DNA_ID=CAMNT_0018710275 /DNA_START=61 /DNA_END=444 /DNA_ORIENTATION=-
MKVSASLRKKVARKVAGESSGFGFARKACTQRVSSDSASVSEACARRRASASTSEAPRSVSTASSSKSMKQISSLLAPTRPRPLRTNALLLDPAQPSAQLPGLPETQPPLDEGRKSTAQPSPMARKND